MFKEKYGEWAVVAGAAEGIGLAFSEEIAQKGLNLVLIDIQKEKLKTLAETLEKRYCVQTKTIVADLALGSTAEYIKKETESLEVGLMVYNTAYSAIGNFFDNDIEAHRKLLKVNCLAPLEMIYHFGKKMLPRKRGGMVLMSSMIALQGVSVVSHYAASKAYNLLLGEGLWNELKARNIDVIAVCAGATRTPNYLKSPFRQKTLFTPPSLEPKVVARQTLKHIGKKPSLIVGFWNRMSAILLKTFLSRKEASKLVSKELERLYNAP